MDTSKMNLPEGFELDEEKPTGFSALPEGFVLEKEEPKDEGTLQQMKQSGQELTREQERILFDAEDKKDFTQKASEAITTFVPTGIEIAKQLGTGAGEFLYKGILKPIDAMSQSPEEAEKTLKEAKNTWRSGVSGVFGDIQETSDAVVRFSMFGSSITDKLLGKSNDERFEKYMLREGMRQFAQKVYADDPDNAARLLAENPLLQKLASAAALAQGATPEEAELAKKAYEELVKEQGLTKDEINENVSMLGEMLSPISLPGTNRITNTFAKATSKVTRKAGELALKGVVAPLAKGVAKTAGGLESGIEKIQGASRKIGEYAVGDPDTFVKTATNTIVGPAKLPAKMTRGIATTIGDVAGQAGQGRRGMFELAGRAPTSGELTKKLFGPQAMGGKGRARVADWAVRQSNAIIQPAVNGAVLNVALGLPDIETARDLGYSAGVGAGIGAYGGARLAERAGALIDPTTGLAEKIDAIVTPDPSKLRKDEDADIQRFIKTADPTLMSSIDELSNVNNIKSALDLKIKNLEAKKVAQINKDDERRIQDQIDNFAEQRKALDKSTPQTEAEIKRQVQLSFTDAMDLAKTTGAAAGLNNIQVKVLRPDQMEDFYRNLYGKTLTDAESVVQQLVGNPRLSPSEKEMLGLADQTIKQYLQDVAGSSTARGFAISEQTGRPNHLKMQNQTGATVVINGDLVTQMGRDGLNLGRVINHEMQHALSNFQEVRDMIAPIRKELFDQKVINADGTFEVVKKGVIPDSELDKFALQYAAAMDASGGASFLSNFANQDQLRNYMKEEYLSELAGLSGGIQGNLRGNLDSVGRSVVDWIESRTKNGALKRVKEALRNYGVIVDDQGQFSSVIGGELNPEALAMMRQYQRGLRDLNESLVYNSDPVKDEAEIPLTVFSTNRALQQRYKDSEFFEQQQVVKMTTPDGQTQEIVIPPNVKVDSFISDYRFANGELVDELGNVISLGPDIPLQAMPDGTSLSVDTRIARNADGSPRIISPRESKRRAKKRGEAIRKAIDEAPEDASGVRLEDTGNGNYRGTLSPTQVAAINALPNDLVAPSLKRKIAFFNEILGRKDGSIVDIEYQAAIRDKKYRALQPQMRTEIPFGFQFDKQGNFLMTTMSMSRMHDKANAWAAKRPRNLRLWGGDMTKFWDSVRQYLYNHKQGLQGHIGLNPDPEIAMEMKNRINDLFNVYRKETRDANPDRTTLPKRKGQDSRDVVIRSRRMDRINSYDETALAKMPFSYESAVKNYLPAENPLAELQSPEQFAQAMEIDTELAKLAAQGNVEPLELQLHQQDLLHPAEYIDVENGKLRVRSMFDPTQAILEPMESEPEVSASATQFMPAETDRAKFLSAELEKMYEEGGTDKRIANYESELEGIYQKLESDQESTATEGEENITEYEMNPQDVVFEAINNYKTGKVDNQQQTLAEHIRNVFDSEGKFNISPSVTDAEIESAANDIYNQKAAQRQKITGLQFMPAETERYPTSERGMYSGLQKTIDQKVQGKFASPDQLKAIVSNPQNAKAEELKWSGVLGEIDRLAAENSGKVPKDKVMDYLRNEGAVKFEEVTLGQDNSIQKIANEYRIKIEDEYGEKAFYDEFDEPLEFDELPIRLQDAIEQGKNVLEPKHSTYQLPGGTNYREVVMTMPDPKLVRYNELNKIGATYMTDEQFAEYKQLEKSGLYKNQYTSSHFPDTPNYVAHMRLNERTDAQGNEGLFVEELQSDRHQAGREKGYIQDVQIDENRIFDDNGVFRVKGVYDPSVKFKTKGDALEYIKSITLHGRDLIPDAPFRKDWSLQLFKRALRDAVESDKKWIGWTTGIEQVKRYEQAMRQAVDEITWNTPKGYQKAFAAIKNGNTVLAGKINDDGSVYDSDTADANGKQLSEVLGKEVASKILAENSGTATGDDLTVGGEGMKGFYDQILPKEVGKYVAKMGGKVEKSIINKNPLSDRPNTFYKNPETGEIEKMPQGTPIWRVNITPEMAGKVRGGQLQFMPADSENIKYSNPPSEKQAIDALSSNKRNFFGMHRDLEDGYPVGLRIDIPAFTSKGVYVVTVHEKKKGAERGSVGDRIGYDTIAKVDNPIFFSNEVGAKKIKSGESNKFPVATVEGQFNSSREIPEDINEWTPVGYNPKDHSYFYDKTNEEPVLSGDEAISVGNTVFVKNPVYGNKANFAFMPAEQPTEYEPISARIRPLEGISAPTKVVGAKALSLGEIEPPVRGKAMLPDMELKPDISEKGIQSSDKTGLQFMPAEGEEKSKISPKIDTKYLAAIERSDMETAQRMVDEAAKKEGYDIGPVWHGSPDFIGNEFDLNMRGRRGLSRGGFSFTRNKDAAEAYMKSGVDTSQKIVDDANALMKELQSRVDAGLEWNGPYNEVDVPFFRSDSVDDIDLFQSYISEISNTLPSDLKLIANELAGRTSPEDYTANPRLIRAFLKQPKTIDISGKELLLAESPAQIKSADPVTYDNVGNVIPLSQRFNKKTSDIRFMPASLVTKTQTGYDYTYLDEALKNGKNGKVALTRPVRADEALPLLSQRIPITNQVDRNSFDYLSPAEVEFYQYENNPVSFKFDPALLKKPVFKDAAVEHAGKNVQLAMADRQTTTGGDMGGILYSWLKSNIDSTVIGDDGIEYRAVWGNQEWKPVLSMKNKNKKFNSYNLLTYLMGPDAHASNTREVRIISNEIENANISRKQKDLFLILANIGVKNQKRADQRDNINEANKDIDKTKKLIEDSSDPQEIKKLNKSIKQRENDIVLANIKYNEFLENPNEELIKSIIKNYKASYTRFKNKTGSESNFIKNKKALDDFKKTASFKDLLKTIKNKQLISLDDTFKGRKASIAQILGLTIDDFNVDNILDQTMDFKNGRINHIVGSIELSRNPDLMAVYLGDDPDQAKRMTAQESKAAAQLRANPNFVPHEAYAWAMLGPVNGNHFLNSNPKTHLEYFPDFKEAYASIQESEDKKQKIREGNETTLMGAMRDNTQMALAMPAISDKK